MKICYKCGIKKEIKEFHKKSKTKDGLSYWCKDCCIEYKKKYYSINKKEINIKNKQYNLQHQSYIKEYKKQYYLDNKILIDIKNKNYYINNKEKVIKKNIEWQKNHPEYIKEYMRKRRKNDNNFKILHNLRRRINGVLKGVSKSKRTMELIGCTIDQLRQHLELKFQDGMNWDNHGEWHIDHVKPCVSFDLSKPEEQQKCFHYTNLQPLWAIENIKKGCKLE